MMLDIPVGSPSLAAVPDDVTVFLEQINIAPDIVPVAINLVKKKKGSEPYKSTFPFPLSLTLNTVVMHCILVGISMLVNQIEHFFRRAPTPAPRMLIGHLCFLYCEVPIQSICSFSP